MKGPSLPAHLAPGGQRCSRHRPRSKDADEIVDVTRHQIEGRKAQMSGWNRLDSRLVGSVEGNDRTPDSTFRYWLPPTRGFITNGTARQCQPGSDGQPHEKRAPGRIYRPVMTPCLLGATAPPISSLVLLSHHCSIRFRSGFSVLPLWREIHGPWLDRLDFSQTRLTTAGFYANVTRGPAAPRLPERERGQPGPGRR
jgi:hypothetical protein